MWSLGVLLLPYKVLAQLVVCLGLLQVQLRLPVLRQEQLLKPLIQPCHKRMALPLSETKY
jgi:hypothetical protein